MKDWLINMLESMKECNADYIKFDAGEYSVIIANKDIAKFIDRLLNEDMGGKEE